MMSARGLILCLKIIFVFCGSDFHSDKIISTITFGSCNKEDLDQPLWVKVREQSPDLWIWLGDAVYADTRVLPFLWVHSSLESMKDKFNLQKQNPNYKGLLEDGVPIIGTWDDHDYGLDGVGKTFKYRFQSQNLFLDFLEAPIDSILRKRKGLYSSHTYGNGDKVVKVILLDVRSHHTRGWGCEVLGEEQWNWLENQLNDNTSSIIFIGSGKQILSDIPFIDKWMSCESDLDRLIWLVQKQSKVLFLSGDVHFSEVNCLNASSTGYPIYEFTSSGMTHTCSFPKPKSFCTWTLKNVVASRYRVSNVVTDKSFGVIQIDWSSFPVKFTFKLVGEKGVITQLLLSSDDLIQRRHPIACPAALEQPNYYWKRVFWITVISIGVLSFLICLRIAFLLSRLIILHLIKDLDTKIKRRIKKIRMLLPSSAPWKKQHTKKHLD